MRISQEDYRANYVCKLKKIVKETNMGTSEPTYFRVARSHPGNKIVGSYTWRLHAGGTSFYLKLRETLQDYKISIHGPDPRHSDAGK